MGSRGSDGVCHFGTAQESRRRQQPHEAKQPYFSVVWRRRQGLSYYRNGPPAFILFVAIETDAWASALLLTDARKAKVKVKVAIWVRPSGNISINSPPNATALKQQSGGNNITVPR
jgi:hypothetical protein